MDRTALLDRFRTGFDDVVEALAGITPDELDRRPPDGWTAREIAHHLADSEATAYVRLRRLIAEDDPTIIGYDEEEFARRLHYDRPIEPSLAVLAAVRAASLQLLESLTDEEWQRTGTHSDSGAVLGRRLAADLRRPLARPRRPDPPRAPRRGVGDGA